MFSHDYGNSEDAPEVSEISSSCPSKRLTSILIQAENFEIR
jgi:hypothetical protein